MGNLIDVAVKSLLVAAGVAVIAFAYWCEWRWNVAAAKQAIIETQAAK